MKINSVFKFVTFYSLLFFTLNAYAGNGTFGPVNLDSVGIVNTAVYGHQPGSLEIKITNGMGVVPGVTCNADYITTRNTVAGFKELVSVLLAALAAKKSVLLAVTDDPDLKAYPGRCSLLYAVIQN